MGLRFSFYSLSTLWVTLYFVSDSPIPVPLTLTSGIIHGLYGTSLQFLFSLLPHYGLGLIHRHRTKQITEYARRDWDILHDAITFIHDMHLLHSEGCFIIGSRPSSQLRTKSILQLHISKRILDFPSMISPPISTYWVRMHRPIHGHCSLPLQGSYVLFFCYHLFSLCHRFNSPHSWQARCRLYFDPMSMYNLDLSRSQLTPQHRQALSPPEF